MIAVKYSCGLQFVHIIMTNIWCISKSSGQVSLNQGEMPGNIKEFRNWNIQCAQSSYPILSLVTTGSKEQDG